MRPDGVDVINLCPHDLHVLHANGLRTVLPRAEKPARCMVESVRDGELTLNGQTVPIHVSRFGAVYDLPDPRPDTYFVVSRPVAEACDHLRTDVLVVDDIVRSSDGTIIGCRAFASVR